MFQRPRVELSCPGASSGIPVLYRPCGLGIPWEKGGEGAHAARVALRQGEAVLFARGVASAAAGRVAGAVARRPAAAVALASPARLAAGAPFATFSDLNRLLPIPGHAP